MNRKISVTAAILASIVAAALAGCAPAQMSSFLPANFNQQQTAQQVTPGIVVSVSPVGSVGGGFLSGTRPGEDIIVGTLTSPRQTLSVVQPLKSGAPAFTPGEQVGVVNRDGNSRVIPLPGYVPLGSSKPGTVYWRTPPVTQTHVTLRSPFSN